MASYVIPFGGYELPIDGGETDTFKNILYEVERHCNNYFNPRNDPNDPKRNYPPAFLELVKKIFDYLNKENDELISKNITNYSISEDGGGETISRDVLNSAWTKLFVRELAIYKRAKFI